MVEITKKFRPLGKQGQVGLPQVLSLLIIVFVVFTLGRILFNATVLDPDASDGGINAVGMGESSARAVVNPLMNIGLVTMSGIVIIAVLAGIVIRFF